MPRRHRLRIRTEEWYAVILSAIYCFCILGAYYVIRPMRDQLAVEVGSQQLPLFFAGTFFATLFLTPIFSWLVSLWPRRVVMPLVYLFFLGCQLAFVPFFNDRLLSTQTLGFIFFIWVSVFNLFVVSIFWSFMTDIWNDEQARRLFPIIALGGTLGGIIGPIITGNLVETIGFGFLLVVSAGLLFIAIICVLLLGNWAHQHGAHRYKKGNEAAVGGKMLDGIKQIFTNPFIASMALMMLLTDGVGTIAYVLITDYSGLTFPNDVIAQTRFAAHMDLAANAFQIVIQLSLTRWLLVRYGAGSVFALATFVVVLACIGLVFSENPYDVVIGKLPWIALVLIISRSLLHSMIQPARETLYTLVPRSLRYKGKNAVDTVVWRAGDVASMALVSGAQSVGVTVAGFAMIWAALAAASGWIGWSLSNRVERGTFEDKK